MTVHIYGIKNCDTMKKAFNWLDENGIQYTFHDYKKEGVDEQLLRKAIAEHGWQNVINRKGTTWRQLPDSMKESMDDEAAVKSAMANPSLIKRPLMAIGKGTCLGFSEEGYRQLSG